MKRTPLYERHVALGGKMIDFEGWAMPVQYSGILDEHRHVRTSAGLFDVSHMGEIIVRGRHAEHFLQMLLTNDIMRTANDRAVYSPMCYPEGGVVDDLLVYRLAPEEYLLVVNAANTAKDLDWIRQAARLRQARNTKITVEDVSEQYAQLALQGPGAAAILQNLCPLDLRRLNTFAYASRLTVAGASALVSRTGYTGEDGFEIYLAPATAGQVWDSLLETGQATGLVPAGLGARDSLRLEAALPLYGQDIKADISPLEAGLGRFIKLDKEEFIGKESLLQQRETGLSRERAGLVLGEAGVMRSQCGVFDDGKKIGSITSGGYSPTLQKSIGLALIDRSCIAEGVELAVEIRDRRVKARVVRLPFYSRKKPEQMASSN